MSEHELEKLLGGFAADTLTAEEKQQLYGAALQDQQLFNALADEQALKELLADPVVRRRLLQTLNQARTSGSGGSLSWLDWIRRPAGLAFAGGLAAAAFAVVLGTKIYQDSLQQAARSIATEEAQPLTPSTPKSPASQSVTSQVAEQQPKVKENVAPTVAPAKKDVLVDKMAKRERAVPFKPQEPRASDAARDSAVQQREQDAVSKQAEAPVVALGKAAEGERASADNKLAASPAPPAAASEPKQLQAPAAQPAPGTVAPTVSARALFYGGAILRSNTGKMAREKERTMKSMTESTPQATRPEQKMEPFALGGKEAAGMAAQLKPLGLRYSFLIQGTDGQEREVDSSTASHQEGPIRLTVESNQDSYVQIWKADGPSTSELLFPPKGSGQLSSQLTAGRRQSISMPAERSPVTIRLSRIPFEAIGRQETAMYDMSSTEPLQESVTAGGASGSQEQATYVVNPDTSLAELSVIIPLGKP